MPTIQQTIIKISGFRKFPHGWNFGSGVPLSEEMFLRGITLLKLAEAGEIERSNAFLGDDGELQITFHFNKDTAAFTLEVDGTVSITEDEEGKIVSQLEELSDNESYSRLWEISKAQNSLELSTSNTIGTRRMVGFLRRRLDRHRMINVYRWSRHSVLKKTACQSANTYKNITLMLRGIRSSSGISAKKFFQTTAKLNKVSNRK
jgi:hypothetical protein